MLYYFDQLLTRKSRDKMQMCKTYQAEKNTFQLLEQNSDVFLKKISTLQKFSSYCAPEYHEVSSLIGAMIDRLLRYQRCNLTGKKIFKSVLKKEDPLVCDRKSSDAFF